MSAKVRSWLAVALLCSEVLDKIAKLFQKGQKSVSQKCVAGVPHKKCSISNRKGCSEWFKQLGSRWSSKAFTTTLANLRK